MTKTDILVISYPWHDGFNVVTGDGIIDMDTDGGPAPFSKHP